MSATKLNLFSPEAIAISHTHRQERIEKENKLITSISNPDYEHEAKKSSWTLEATVALTLSWNPREIKRRAIKPSEFIGPAGEDYQKRLELIKNTAIPERFGKIFVLEIGNPMWTIFPRQFLEWAEKMDIPVPDELVRLVKKYSPKVNDTDWGAEYEKLKTTNSSLKKEINKKDKNIEVLGEENKEMHGVLKRVCPILTAIISMKPYSYRQDKSNFCAATIEKKFPLSGGYKIQNKTIKKGCDDAVDFCKKNIADFSNIPLE